VNDLLPQENHLNSVTTGSLASVHVEILRLSKCVRLLSHANVNWMVNWDTAIHIIHLLI